MTRSTAGRTYAGARIVAGVGLLVMPGVGARLLGDVSLRGMARLLGARDVLLGVAVLRARPGSTNWRRAMALSAAADAMDAAISGVSVRRGQRVAALSCTTASAGAAIGAWSALHGPGDGGVRRSSG